MFFNKDLPSSNTALKSYFATAGRTASEMYQEQSKFIPAQAQD